jgi:hypothetical protein
MTLKPITAKRCSLYVNIGVRALGRKFLRIWTYSNSHDLCEYWINTHTFFDVKTGKTLTKAISYLFITVPRHNTHSCRPYSFRPLSTWNRKRTTQLYRHSHSRGFSFLFSRTHVHTRSLFWKNALTCIFISFLYFEKTVKPLGYITSTTTHF